MNKIILANNFRRKFLNFMKKNGHKVVPPSPLVPKGDPSVLFTTAGMQQFKPYYINPEQAPATNLATAQPCLRTSDIEEVGDLTHLTLFEMLGNFSFGGYGKRKAIELSLKFITDELGFSRSKIQFSVFRGDKKTPVDQESIKILRSLGIDKKDLIMGDREDNFWGPTGKEGPCGPTVEFYLNGVEIWNLVFNQYFCDKKKGYKPLKIQGIDTGMGMERALAILQGKKSVYQTGIFTPLLKIIKMADDASNLDIRSRRIIADHIRAIVFSLGENIVPDSKERGYILRRLIRRSLALAWNQRVNDKVFTQLIDKVIDQYRESYCYLEKNRQLIHNGFNTELKKFQKTFRAGIKIYRKQTENLKLGSELPPKLVFQLHDTYGLLFELTAEMAKKDGFRISREKFQNLAQAHQIKSRAGFAGKFKGGLVQVNKQTTRLHTAHHLLLASLRAVLGSQVAQRGSNINSKRLRLDFSFNRALDFEELSRVEKMVNEWIAKDCAVTKERMSKEKALRLNALAEFGAQYPDIVSVYTISDQNRAISREICAGPHVKNTKEIKSFKIIKQQSVGANLRRIKAVVE